MEGGFNNYKIKAKCVFELSLLSPSRPRVAAPEWGEAGEDGTSARNASAGVAAAGAAASGAGGGA